MYPNQLCMPPLPSIDMSSLTRRLVATNQRLRERHEPVRKVMHKRHICVLIDSSSHLFCGSDRAILTTPLLDYSWVRLSTA